MKIRLFLITALAMVATFSLAGTKCTKLYMYGFAASFNDSTVYLTDIQEVDSAWTDSKTGFLYSRDNYSYQLRDHLKNLGVAHPTCVTVYAKTRKEIEKKYVALKRRYTTKGNYDVKYIASNEFGYYPITPSEEEIKMEAPEKKKKDRPKGGPQGPGPMGPNGPMGQKGDMNGPMPKF